MSLASARSRLQARIATLLRRKTGSAPRSQAIDADPAEAEPFLTLKETALMLQPRMPNRNALAWLELDRNIDPSLPFELQGEAIVYRLGDVRAFIRRLPQDPATHAVKAERTQSFSERRAGADRRSADLDFELDLVEDDQRLVLDRRTGFDRRSGVDRRETRDTFGYGRNGDRRGLAGKL